MDPTVEKTIKALKRRLINGWRAGNTAEARDIVVRVVPKDAVVGIGDSSSVRQIKLIEALKARYGE